MQKDLVNQLPQELKFKYNHAMRKEYLDIRNNYIKESNASSNQFDFYTILISLVLWLISICLIVFNLNTVFSYISLIISFWLLFINILSFYFSANGNSILLSSYDLKYELNQEEVNKEEIISQIKEKDNIAESYNEKIELIRKANIIGLLLLFITFILGIA